MKIHYQKTNSILDKICEQKIAEVSQYPNANATMHSREYRSLYSELVKNDFAVIAEMKKASPSAGILRKNFDPALIAQAYEKSGAAAISVVTDQKFFQGNEQYLTAAKTATKLPVLQKDFILHEKQIDRALAIGADAILLIAAILDKNQMLDLYNYAKMFMLDVLVEVHDEHELAIILEFNPEIIGINCRDLTTFETDLKVFARIAKLVPEGKIIVAESGINTKSDVAYIKTNRAKAALIGTTLMRSENIEEKYKELFADES